MCKSHTLQLLLFLGNIHAARLSHVVCREDDIEDIHKVTALPVLMPGRLRAIAEHCSPCH